MTLTANDAYSLIGVRGFRPGQAQELNNAINQGSDANIKGAFTLDTGGTNQTFVAQDAGAKYLLALFGDEAYVADAIETYREALKGREDEPYVRRLAARLKQLEAR